MLTPAGSWSRFNKRFMIYDGNNIAWLTLNIPITAGDTLPACPIHAAWYCFPRR
jgi:hypothetical protein